MNINANVTYNQSFNIEKGIFYKHILPFMLLTTLFISIAIIFDIILHKLEYGQIGRYMGFSGTFFIIFSFIYSLNKRRIIRFKRAKILLNLHEYFSCIGTIMILVHGGIHFNAILPWFALVFMLIVVTSGYIGKYILNKVIKETISNRGGNHKDGENKNLELMKQYKNCLSVSLMKKWRSVHMPITTVFAILSIIHIITIFMF